MSRSQFHRTRAVLGLAWLNLRDKHMTTVRIKRVTSSSSSSSIRFGRSIDRLDGERHYEASPPFPMPRTIRGGCPHPNTTYGVLRLSSLSPHPNRWVFPQRAHNTTHGGGRPHGMKWYVRRRCRRRRLHNNTRTRMRMCIVQHMDGWMDGWMDGSKQTLVSHPYQTKHRHAYGLPPGPSLMQRSCLSHVQFLSATAVGQAVAPFRRVPAIRCSVILWSRHAIPCP